MTRRRAFLSLALLTTTCACTADVAPARPQALVFIDTDLPSPGMLDRLRIHVLAGDEDALRPACGGCSQEVAIVSAADWPISFGVEAPPPGERRWVEATLFPAGRIAGGQVLPETSVETRMELHFGDGILAQEVLLEGACVGVPAAQDSAEVCVRGVLAPTVGATPRDPEAPSRVGTFQSAAHRTCAGRPQEDSGLFDDEVCVDGGTFWMGDVRRQGFGGHVDGVPEHPVTLNPFFLDRFEYTVARYRRAFGEGFVTAGSPPGTGTGCHYQSIGDGSMDSYPLNCVDPAVAEELCAFEGRRLPTEAEREWAAGNGAEELLYPWGDLAEYDNLVRMAPGPTPVGTRAFDTTRVGGIRDLAWNVIEWVADDFQTYTEGCWAPGQYGISPRCVIDVGDIDRGHAARGGYWFGAGDAGAAYRAMVPSRQTFPPGQANFVGFRCARDD